MKHISLKTRRGSWPGVARSIAGAIATGVLVAALACSGGEENSETATASQAPPPASVPASPPQAAAVTDPPGRVPPDSAETLAVRGRQIFMANCIACHNVDPSLPGAIGPEIAGSRHELVESKVLRSEYPPGYQPKRDTHAMIPLPHLEPQIDALVAFLAEAGSD